MGRCNKCGKDLVIHRCVMNYYPLRGFPHDTEKYLCDKCKDKFDKYMTKCFDKFFKEEKDERD